MNQDKAQTFTELVQASYPILADSDHSVADAYGVYDLLGDGLATPSIFVIDPNGLIVWSYISTDANDRPASAAILSHLPK